MSKDLPIKKNFYWLIITFLLFLFSYRLWGFYYGWLDDIIMTNLFKGTFFANQGHFSEAVFKGISFPIVFLYEHFPLAPWYSLFLYSILFTSIFLTFKYVFASSHISRLNSYILYSLIAILFYFIFLLEFVVLINYTKVTILAVGISLLLYWEHIKKKSKTLFHPILLFFIISYLIRDQIANIIVILVLGFVTFEVFILKNDKRDYLKYIVTISVIVISINMFFSINTSNDFKLGRERWPYISNIVDGKRHETYSDKIKNKNDSIKVFALQAYYFFDTSKIDISFLERIGSKTPYNISSIANWRHYLIGELKKLEYKVEVGSAVGLNLGNKLLYSCIVSLVFLVVIFSLIKKYNISIRLLYMYILNILFFYLFFFILSIFFKYEDRVFTPSFIVLLSYNTSTTLKHFKNHNDIVLIILSILLIPFSFKRVNQFNIISEWQKKDIKDKLEYIDELNSYDSTIFIHDYWSQFLIYQTPFNEPVINNRNKHIMFGDLPYFELESYRSYLKNEICNYNDFADFYECISKQENVVFIMPPFKKQLIEDYLKILYHKDFTFVEVYPHLSFKNNKVSYWINPIDSEYYKIQLND